MSLEDLSKGKLSLRFNATPQVTLILAPEEGFPDCPVLTGNVAATLNGSPSTFRLSGEVREYEGNYRTCWYPAFVFDLDPLNGSPGAPDGEFVLQDGTYTMRFAVRNLMIERKLIRLTPDAAIKPGRQVRYHWQPATDSLLRGTCSVQGRGDYLPPCSAQAESGSLIVDLPAAPWPAGADYFASGYATAPVDRCEGVQKCELLEIILQDHIVLPTL